MWHIFIALRNYSVRHITWPHSDLIITQNQKGLNVKCWGISESCLSGWICIFGAAGRAEGSDAVGWTVESVTYCPKHCDTEEQKQVPSEVQCRALQKTCHHWSEREGNTTGDAMVRGDVGSPVIQGPGGLRARVVRGICHYHQFVPQSDLTHGLWCKRSGKLCQNISLELQGTQRHSFLQRVSSGIIK